MNNTRLAILGLFALAPLLAHAGSETRPVTAFRELDVSGAIQVTWEPGEPFASVEADDDVLPKIRVEQNGDRLSIRTKSSVNTQGSMRVTLHGPALKVVSVTGASRVNATGLTTDLRELSASGASRIFVAGETNELQLLATGASRIDATKLPAKRVKADASGASQIELHATESLKAVASGASQIDYSGKPPEVRQDATGASRITASR